MLEWNYLWCVWEAFGLGKGFISMLKMLYSASQGVVQTGNILSKYFCFQRSTKQGCPLSPMLFALSLEPLAQAIRLDPLISPINIKGTQHKVSLYANDTLLYFADFSISLPQILKWFTIFGSFSRYKLGKSIRVPLNSPVKCLTLPAASPVQWHKADYLFGDMHTHQISKVCRRNSLKISLQGRIAIVKMKRTRTVC